MRRRIATRRRKTMALALMTTGLASNPAGAQEEPTPMSFRVDDRAMCAFEYHLGTWQPGDPDAPPGVRIEHEWGIPAKSVRGGEYREIEGEEVRISHEVAGYHYGLQRIEWHAFVRDGIASFEVMNTGWIEFRPGDVMVRRYRSYDPDTSSREYRETFTPLDEDRRRNRIEYRDDEGRWREWAVFEHVRAGPRVRSDACRDLATGENAPVDEGSSPPA